MSQGGARGLGAQTALVEDQVWLQEPASGSPLLYMWGALDQLVHTAWIVAQCLRDLRGLG